MSGTARGLALLLAMILLAPVPARSAGSEDDPRGKEEVVRVSAPVGEILGLMENGTEVFRGIPYAAAPTGKLRWAEPQAHPGWDGSLEAFEFGPACPQNFNLLFADAGRQSEDCLYLNIWTDDSSSGSKPVLVYIHGGAFQYGSGSQAVYDGSYLASRGVVVVTFNYRLGILGFLAHPQLSAESETGSSGNYGLLDQLAVLRWIQQNISAFGGDPGNVTLMGESAGAVSVCSLMSSPLADGLFHRAIAMSGGAPDRIRDLRTERLGLASMEDVGSKWVESAMDSLGLAGLDELREVPWEELQKVSVTGNRREMDIVAMMSMDDSICIDGNLLTDSPAAVFSRGEQMDVPFIAGSLENEGGMFTMGLRLRDLNQYHGLLGVIFGTDAGLAGRLYPAESTDLAVNQLASFISDGFAAGARHAVREMAGRESGSWLYRFDYESPAARLSGLGTFHGSELPYFFGSYPVPLVYGRGSLLLTDRLADYFVSFMETGNPNGEGRLFWPEYDSAHEQLLVIDLPMEVAELSRAEQLDLIEQRGLW